VGSNAFVERVRDDLGGRDRHRTIAQEGDDHLLREARGAYACVFGGETAPPG